MRNLLILLLFLHQVLALDCPHTAHQVQSLPNQRGPLPCMYSGSFDPLSKQEHFYMLFRSPMRRQVPESLLIWLNLDPQTPVLTHVFQGPLKVVEDVYIESTPEDESWLS